MGFNKKITLSIFVTAFICYGIVNNEKKSSASDKSLISNQPQSLHLNHTATSSSYQTQCSQKSQDLNRSEILKKKLKGYREHTYWGAEHPIDETVNQMDDEEFRDFIEDEIPSNDAGVYWGEEY